MKCCAETLALLCPYEMTLIERRGKKKGVGCTNGLEVAIVPPNNSSTLMHLANLAAEWATCREAQAKRQKICSEQAEVNADICYRKICVKDGS